MTDRLYALAVATAPQLVGTGRRRPATHEETVRWANRLFARHLWSWHGEDWEWL